MHPSALSPACLISRGFSPVSPCVLRVPFTWAPLPMETWRAFWLSSRHRTIIVYPLSASPDERRGPQRKDLVTAILPRIPFQDSGPISRWNRAWGGSRSPMVGYPGTVQFFKNRKIKVTYSWNQLFNVCLQYVLQKDMGCVICFSNELHCLNWNIESLVSVN